MMFELKIGYCSRIDNDFTKIVHKEKYHACSLNAAKAKATRILKGLPQMQKYLIDRRNKNVKWSVWSQKVNHKGDFWFTNKQSRPIFDKKSTYGFCQLTWENMQMSLFEGAPASVNNYAQMPL